MEILPKKTLSFLTKLLPPSSSQQVDSEELKGGTSKETTDINELLTNEFEVIDTENPVKEEIQNREDETNDDSTIIIENNAASKIKPSSSFDNISITKELNANETGNTLNKSLNFERLNSYEIIPNQVDPHERHRFIRKLKGKDSQMRNSEELVTALSSAFWSPNIPTPYVYTPKMVTVGIIWETFFNQSYDLSIQCMKLGVLFIDDFMNEEPFLFIGLPAFILIEAIHRSLVCDDGFVLSNGLRLTSENCPGEEKLLYNLLNKLRNCMADLQPTPIEVTVLKLRILFACEEEREIPTDLLEQIEDSRIIKINLIAGEVTGVAIHLTQEAIFKKNFGKTLLSIVDQFTEKD